MNDYQGGWEYNKTVFVIRLECGRYAKREHYEMKTPILAHARMFVNETEAQEHADGFIREPFEIIPLEISK